MIVHRPKHILHLHPRLWAVMTTTLRMKVVPALPVSSDSSVESVD
jgi:hypothetical protein